MKNNTLIKFAAVLLLNILPTVLFAQEQGIRFEHGLEWWQILEKAKAEHKYIFVDCYATWCVPCKYMDANIYPLKQVGDAYNDKFILVRLQMDRNKADNDTVKSWYGLAKSFESSYSVNAYPTFLFFDPDGKPVHKAVGSFNVKGFIQLAADAQNPDKQYYSILQNFQPGKLDTAELKGLARSFMYSDRTLAGKLALDYLSRIPKQQLSSKSNRDIVLELQDNDDILAIGLNEMKGLSRDEFGIKENLEFMEGLADHQASKEIAVDYITKLDKSDLGKKANIQFMASFRKEPKVKEIAKNYIDQLSEKELYTELTLQFVLTFTDQPTDRGFMEFYHHADKVNSVLKDNDNDYAQEFVAGIITKADLGAAFDQAKKTETAPNFDSIAKVVNKKYNAEYAERVVINGRVNFYSYLARTKKEEKFWPDYIAARIIQVDKFRYDTAADRAAAINDICWGIFLHGNDTRQLMTVAHWMKEIVDKAPENSRNKYLFMDTYASLLFKAGQTDEALTWEQKALQLATEKKDAREVKGFTTSIEKMKNGEKFWLEKPYID